MTDYDDRYDDCEDGYLRNDFYDPGGRSALRAGVRRYPCPTCGKKNALTFKDVKLGYQCDRCADIVEGLYPSADY